MQIFLLGYILVEICEIFTVGGFPLHSKARIVFTAIHLGAIVATTWVLLLNGVVGFQVLDDGTPISIGLVLFSAAALFIGTGYIALDTGLNWTAHFAPSLNDPNRNIGLYVLYQLAPIIFLVIFFILETVLVLHVLGERKPMSKSSLLGYGTLLIAVQYISWRQQSCLPLARSSNTSSVLTSAKGQRATLTERCLRPYSPSWPSSCSGSFGRASRKTTGPWQRLIPDVPFR